MTSGTMLAGSLRTSQMLPSTMPTDFNEIASQASVKGGIGFYVAQGLAKRGYSCNPNHQCFSHTRTRKSLQKQLANITPSAGLVDEADPEVFQHAALDFERNKKADVFRVASRSTRCSDLDTTSKWAALSFFESDPNRIKHHLNILQAIDNQGMLDSLARRAEREQRLTAVQDRIRYEFGVRQLHNTIKSRRSGQRTLNTGSPSSVYTLCHTGMTLTSSKTSSRPHTSRDVARQPAASASQNCTMGPPTALPSAAWALQADPQTTHKSGVCEPAGRPCAAGTPKVGLSTWYWGGASATLAAIAGRPAQAPPASAAALPPRPQTARPFRIRTRMDAELQADMRQKLQQRRARSAHPSRRPHCGAQDLLELDRFQQRLDYWRARQKGALLHSPALDTSEQRGEAAGSPREAQPS